YQLPTAAPYAPTLVGLAATVGTTLTSGFPSTTPTSLVTLGAGVPPGAHGVLGFKVRVPDTDRVLSHIEWTGDPEPLRWQPVPTQYERARAAGVAVTVVSRPEYGGSGLTLAANRGGDYRGASDVDALAGQMLAALAAGTGPTLVSGYHPDLDRHGHLSGVDSVPWRLAAAEVDRLLARLVDELPPDAALLVTADHGQLNVPQAHRFDLDTDPQLRAGVRVVAGEPRVRYLHVEPGAAADVVAAWSAVLGDAARVMERAEAVATGWFGPVSEEHLRRIGDVVVACRGTYAVVATRSEKPIESRLVAYHGSDTAAEMTIPLLVLRG
ncbi:alkaline phosphatase family protein, partial [Micromonospora globispora]